MFRLWLKFSAEGMMLKGCGFSRLAMILRRGQVSDHAMTVLLAVSLVQLTGDCLSAEAGEKVFAEATTVSPLLTHTKAAKRSRMVQIKTEFVSTLSTDIADQKRRFRFNLFLDTEHL